MKDKIKEYGGYIEKDITDNEIERYKKDGKIVPKLIADDILKFNWHKFVTLKDTKEIFYYDKGVFRTGGEEVIMEEAKERLGHKLNNYLLNEIKLHIKISTFFNRDDFDKNKNIINLSNGTYDIKNQEFSNFSDDPYENASLNSLPLEYKENADCPLFKKFLTEVMYEEDIPLMQEIFGWMLQKNYKYQKAIMLIGGGSNGKSVLLSVLKSFLGSKNIANITLQSLSENPFAASGLFGKLANIFADLSSKALHNTGTFKTLTGCDQIEADRKFRERIQFTNYAKLIFSCNQLPETKDDTDSYFRRWLLIKFPNQFTDESADKNLPEKLSTSDELSGILNWAIEGSIRLEENQNFSKTKSAIELRDEYERASSPIRAFIKDKIIKDLNGFIPKHKFYEEYVSYCHGAGVEAKAMNQVSSKVVQLISGISAQSKHIEGKRVKCWVGIRFKDDNGLPVLPKDDNGNSGNSISLFKGVENSRVINKGEVLPELPVEYEEKLEIEDEGEVENHE